MVWGGGSRSPLPNSKIIRRQPKQSKSGKPCAKSDKAWPTPPEQSVAYFVSPTVLLDVLLNCSLHLARYHVRGSFHDLCRTCLPFYSWCTLPRNVSRQNRSVGAKPPRVDILRHSHEPDTASNQTQLPQPATYSQKKQAELQWTAKSSLNRSALLCVQLSQTTPDRFLPVSGRPRMLA